MRYAFITPRHTVPAPVVSDAILLAREEVGRAIKNGSVRDIDRAYERLESASRLACARRASQHAVRVVTRTLPGIPAPAPVPPLYDPAWERMVAAVEGWRK